MATLYFFKAMYKYVNELMQIDDPDYGERVSLIMRKLEQGAYFDSRCFSIPKEEVINCLIWRQQDATRNSIQALAQSLFPHKELQGLKCNQLQDKIFTEKGINWNDLSTYQKRGACAVKKMMPRLIKDKNGNKIGIVDRPKWVIDLNIPIFTQDRDYVESRLSFEEE